MPSAKLFFYFFKSNSSFFRSSDHANLSAWRKGREAIVEVMPVDRTIKEIIYEGTFARLKPYLEKANYPSFRLAAIDKVTRSITTVEEILRILPLNAFST